MKVALAPIQVENKNNLYKLWYNECNNIYSYTPIHGFNTSRLGIQTCIEMLIKLFDVWD